MYRKQAGFTIVEVAIVVSVISILVSITIVAFNNVQKQARDDKRNADMTTIVHELNKFYEENGEYPPSMVTTAQNPDLFLGKRQIGADFLQSLVSKGVSPPNYGPSISWSNKWFKGAGIDTPFYNIPSQPNAFPPQPEGYLYYSTGAGEGTSYVQTSDTSGGCKLSWSSSPMYIIGYWSESQRTHKFFASSNVTITTGIVSTNIPTQICTVSTL